MTTSLATPVQSFHGRLLTTRQDIWDVIDSCPRIYAGGGARIVRIGPSIILKYGRGVHLTEARNIAFLQQARKQQQCTALRLPDLYDFWEEERAFAFHFPETVACILMSYVEGPTVDSIWPQLDSQERQAIYQQVHAALSELHSIQSSVPGPCHDASELADVCRGPVFTSYDAGPFLTIRDLNDWFNERLLVCKQFNRIRLDTPKFEFDKLVMCHMDIAGRNLIYAPQREVWFVDWAFSGFYPPHFEKFPLRRCGDDEFTTGLLQGMHISPKEEHDIRRLLNIGFALTTAAYTKPTKEEM